MILRHTPSDEPPTQLGMHEGDDEVSSFSEYSAVELGELASSASRLLTACLGAKQGGKPLALDPHDQFLLDSATRVVEDALTGLHFLAAKDRLSPGADKIMLCNFLVRMVMHKKMGTGTELRAIKDIKAYFEEFISSRLIASVVSEPKSAISTAS